ncbi:hypothetical protein [Streptomyces marianii]|uniref:Uncharacterized protein n=1 Tax=Streptomyces marianii TaxID=1817406 RepID=A0A5R9EIM4_9ACTN|nr:hypothetical protein [Streptomyces marianii]TLQ47614.1 hypothetical protein FEF34_35890 [Streptomyces marianii]
MRLKDSPPPGRPRRRTTLLLDLDGLAVTRVERLEDGTRRVHLITADEQGLPRGWVFATRVKGSATTRPRDPPYGEGGLEFGQRLTRGIPSPIQEMISRWISLLPPPKVKITAER